MKKDTWKTVIQIAISILTAIATTLGVPRGWVANAEKSASSAKSA